MDKLFSILMQHHHLCLFTNIEAITVIDLEPFLIHINKRQIQPHSFKAYFCKQCYFLPPICLYNAIRSIHSSIPQYAPPNANTLFSSSLAAYPRTTNPLPPQSSSPSLLYPHQTQSPIHPPSALPHSSFPAYHSSLAPQ